MWVIYRDITVIIYEEEPRILLISSFVRVDADIGEEDFADAGEGEAAVETDSPDGAGEATGGEAIIGAGAGSILSRFSRTFGKDATELTVKKL